MRERNHYKFTRKKHSRRGMLACALAAASIFALVYLILSSLGQKGNGDISLGAAGVISLLVAVAAFVQAAISLREDDTFRGIPVVSMLLSVLAAGAWIALYTVGFLMV